INVPLPPLTGDDLYEEVLNNIVEKVLRESSPEILLLSAGFDAHKEDPITSMKLSVNSFVKIAEMIKRLKENGVTRKFIFVLEGGYGPGLAKGVYNILACLIDLPSVEKEDKTISTSGVKQSGLKVIGNVIEKILKPYWGLE
ncbi:MAG: hypothetical protein DRJ60_01000, partial [Thermoprotei archaeon]